jgi:hypothetical protein
MKTLAYGKTGGCIVFACGKHPLDDDEWDGYVNFLDKEVHLHKRFVFLVHADGAGPTAPQRTRVNEVLAPVGKEDIQAAVMTSSQIVRGIVGVMAWIRPVYKAFTPTDVDAALKFLGIAEPDMPKVKLLLAELKHELVKP